MIQACGEHTDAERPTSAMVCGWGAREASSQSHSSVCLASAQSNTTTLPYFRERGMFHDDE